MPHPEIENHTPFVAEPLFLIDEEARPLLTMVVKVTFDIPNSRQGTLLLAGEQAPLNVGGERWSESEDPNLVEESSYRYEPEVAAVKLATDVAFIGLAHAAKRNTSQMNVSVQVGALGKILRVFGDRVWCRSLGALVLSPPTPFELQRVSYEYAFGGWDRSNPDPHQHEFEARNPVGRGFVAKKSQFQDYLRAPNIEDPQQLVSRRSDRPTPGGFGFISPNWQPRARLAGTYDEAWSKQRSPLLPNDFERRFFNAASPGLVAPGFLRGDETIRCQGLTPEGFVAFQLPGIPPPELRISLHNGQDQSPACCFDTLIVDLERSKLFMLWRAMVSLRTGPHDVRAIEITCPEAENLPRAQGVIDNVANTQIYGVRA